MAEQLTAWSISRLLDYEACPHRVYLRHIVKSPTPDLPADNPMIRGRRIHTEVEHYISGTTDEFPSSGKKMKETLDYCKDSFTHGYATVEERWGFTDEWAITGWFDSNIWLRMATDCTVQADPAIAEIYDWKTGKSFGNEVKYMQQMQLYAVGAFMRFPEVEYVDVTLGFLDDGKQRMKNFERNKKIPELIAKFTERAMRMINCIDWRPKPNTMNCKYCPFGPATGTGSCVHGVLPL